MYKLYNPPFFPNPTPQMQLLLSLINILPNFLSKPLKLSYTDGGTTMLENYLVATTKIIIYTKTHSSFTPGCIFNRNVGICRKYIKETFIEHYS